MALRELVGSATDAASVKRVFGQPIEKDGLTVIPVASVRGGFGGGEAEAAGKPQEAEAKPASWGGGGAWSATPAGVYVIKDGELSWHPAVDTNRTILLGWLTGIVGLLVVRSVVRAIVKRA